MGKALREWATIMFAALAVAWEEWRLRRAERRVRRMLEKGEPPVGNSKRGE